MSSPGTNTTIECYVGDVFFSCRAIALCQSSSNGKLRPCLLRQKSDRVDIDLLVAVICEGQRPLNKQERGVG